MRPAIPLDEILERDWSRQVRELQHAHRLQHVTPKVSRRKPRGQWNINHAGLHDNIARARAEGAAQWTEGEAA